MEERNRCDDNTKMDFAIVRYGYELYSPASEHRPMTATITARCNSLSGPIKCG